MNKIIMTRGLPASGKSWWAKKYIKENPNTKRLNKDDFRSMLDDGKWSEKNEKIVEKLFDNNILQLLLAGYDVILDNTHLSKKYPQHYIDYMRANGGWFLDQDYTLEIKDFDTSLEECISRDKNRANPVGADVISRWYREWYDPTHQQIHTPKKFREQWKEKPYSFDLPECVICDLDGTLALFEGNPYDRDFSKDKFNLKIGWMLRNLPPHIDIIFFSGRDSKFRKVTKEWLEANGIKWNFQYERLYMREEGDKRSDDLVKKEFYDKYIDGKYNVDMIFDDRPKVVRLWSKLGLYCFDCNQSREEF